MEEAAARNGVLAHLVEARPKTTGGKNRPPALRHPLRLDVGQEHRNQGDQHGEQQAVAEREAE